MSWETEVEALAKAMKTEQTETNRTYQATVSRIDSEGRAWVRVAGSDKETPTESRTTGVQKGDTVTIEWRNNRLYIAGNTSDPAVGETRVGAVAEAANKAQEAAELVGKVVELINQYFWHTESGQDSGAHITEIPKEDFVKDPAHGGGNLLARSNGIAIRNGLSELATFSASELRIGDNTGTDPYLTLNPTKLEVRIGSDVIFEANFQNNVGAIYLKGSNRDLVLEKDMLQFDDASIHVYNGNNSIAIYPTASSNSYLEYNSSGKLNLVGATPNVLVNGTPQLVAEEHVISNSVTATAYTDVVETVTKAGYYPLGIVGWRMANGLGQGGTYAQIYRLYISSASVGSARVSAGVRGSGGTVDNCTLYATILWRKER